MTEGRPTPRKTRLAMRILLGFAAVFAAGLAALLWMRVADRDAWPAPLADVRLEPEPAPRAGSATNAWDVLRKLRNDDAQPQAIDAATQAELRRFDALGLSTNAPYPALDAWLQRETGAFALWSEAAQAEFAWGEFDDMSELFPLVLRVVELARLSTYRSAQAVASNDWPSAVALWTETLRVAQHLPRGPGTVGLFVALNATLGACRDILVAVSEHDVPPDAAASMLEVLRDAEASLPPLAESLRRDRALARRALAALFTPRTRAMDAETARRHPPALALWFADRLGSTPVVSTAHLDAVCSHAIAASERPYAPEGLFVGLPPWCRLDKRAPWSRDPLGALATTVFIRNVASAAAYVPNLQSELRAARIAITLSLARHAAPDRSWPPDMAGLAAHGLDAAALLDPFAKGNAPFLYQVQTNHWVVHSVGLDQKDNDGAVDWFSAPEGTREADIVYTSAERVRRAEAWRAAEGASSDSKTTGVP